jgi:hypothetical protein
LLGGLLKIGMIVAVPRPGIVWMRAGLSPPRRPGHGVVRLSE